MVEIEITLDDEVASWVHAGAAEKNQTVSDFVADLLRQRREYFAAMEQALSRPPVMLGAPGEPLPKREDLYDRPRKWQRDND